MAQLVVFTDLDGTLLDPATYAWEPARPALQLLHDRGIPLVFCSSKTRAEIEYYRRQMSNRAPFVTENGGGIFIPYGYFEPALLPPAIVSCKSDRYSLIRLGIAYRFLRRAVEELRADGFQLTGFGDMTVAEVAELTGLSIDQAAMAKAREFDEPFIFDGSPAEVDALKARILAKGLRFTKGAFFHLLGNSDKGVAVAILMDLYRKKFGEIKVIALGDSPNDLPMLVHADHPVAIRKPDGHHDPNLVLPNLIKTGRNGPNGWSEAILRILGGPGEQ